ncbi:MAG: S8 family serine peptidase, partial [Bacteroidota bacterium]|nr:S8 family serine peptidase [Bacteroidota bacterium]
MKKISIFCFIVLTAWAQEKPIKYWIYFTSKPQLSFAKTSSPSEYAQSLGISERAVTRRAKMSTSIISEEDFPISQEFITQLQHHGIVIQHQLRWFNAVTAYLTSDQEKEIAALPFVKNIETVRVFKRKELPRLENPFPKNSTAPVKQRYDYGPSLTQMQMMDAVAVHNIGISGRGVLVGMLDSGFRWREHEALKNLNVIAEYDFIQKDTVTANEAGDSANQDSHGTSTLSLVGGFKEGQLVSPAFNANFILGKTEYVPTETNVEEDNWAAAIEWMEQHGVDVVSSSLGYSEFDATDANGNPQHSYIYADMNGRTATTTKAAVIAARKGVVVVNAMGNEAQASWHFLTAPADADSIISVGAVSSSGIYASFSSVGPTSDGRIKPDVAAQGVFNYCAVPGKIAYNATSRGTSFSTPMTAGVCAMLLSARPELTPIQVRDAL